MQQTKNPLTILAVGYASSAHVQSRVRCFAELGHKVFLVTEVPSQMGIPGVIELVPSLSRVLAKSHLVRAFAWVARNMLKVNPDHVWRAITFLGYLRRHRPNVVHVHYAYSYYGWMAGVFGCSPLVVTVMGGDVLFDEQGSPTEEGKWLTLNLLRRADYITSKSNHLSDALERLAGVGAKAERIFWGVHLSQFRRIDASDLRERLGIDGDRRIILSSGEFSSRCIEYICWSRLCRM